MNISMDLMLEFSRLLILYNSNGDCSKSDCNSCVTLIDMEEACPESIFDEEDKNKQYLERKIVVRRILLKPRFKQLLDMIEFSDRIKAGI